MAAGDRFKKYGEFVIIDSLAKQYSYSHEDVFKLSWGECMNLVAYNREYSYVENKAREYSRKSAKR